MKNQRRRKKNKNDRHGWAARVVIAVALALFLWVYINGSSINLISRDIKNVPVTIINEESLTAKGLVLEDQENYYVNLRVRGTESNINHLDTSLISASADLSDVKTDGIVTPHIVIQGLPNTVILDEIRPKTLKLSIDKISDRRQKVAVNTSGTPAKGLSVIAASTSDTVKVNGSRSDLGKIDELVATADVNGITNDTSIFLRVKAYDEKGKELENVRCEPASVLAHIQVGTTKKVKVKAPKISGTPQDGYEVTDVSVTPTTVLLGGDKKALDKITSVTPQNINVNGIKDDKAVESKINLPDGVIAMKGDIRVMVTAKVEALSEKNIAIHTVEARNVPKGLSVSKISSSTVNVKIEGTQDDLKKISADDISVWVDLADKAEGKESAVLYSKTAKGRIANLTPQKVTVTLKQE
jgi:YbbR domain-containing protein